MINIGKCGLASAGLALLFGVVLLTATSTLAQEGPGGSINPGRDCQTITTCQFSKGGSYRGCLSSYSCRVCRYVPSSCGSSRKRCFKSVCTWG
jgi:hypothetical protein